MHKFWSLESRSRSFNQVSVSTKSLQVKKKPFGLSAVNATSGFFGDQANFLQAAQPSH